MPTELIPIPYQAYKGTPEEYIKEKTEEGFSLLKIVTYFSKAPAELFFGAWISEGQLKESMGFCREIVRVALPELNRKDKINYEYSLRASLQPEKKLKKVKPNNKVTDEEIMDSLVSYQERLEIAARQGRVERFASTYNQ